MNISGKIIRQLTCGNSTITRSWLQHSSNHRIMLLYNIMSCKVSRCMNQNSMTFTLLRQAHTYSSVKASKQVYEDKEYYDEGKNEEIVYVRNFFKTSSHYSKLIFIPTKVKLRVSDEEALMLLQRDWKSVKSHEIVSAMKRLAYHCLSDGTEFKPQQYNGILEALISNLHQIIDKNSFFQLLHDITIMRHKLRGNHLFQHLCKQLDAQCKKTYLKVSMDEVLWLGDVFYELQPVKQYCYIWYALKSLETKLYRFTPKHMVHMLFLLSVMRSSPINMYEVEYHLQNCLDQLSINEIGIAVMGFFKTRTPIRDVVFMKYILTRMIQNIEQIDSVPLGACLKLIRYNGFQNSLNSLTQNLLYVLQDHLPRFHLYVVTQLAHVLRTSVIYDTKTINTISHRLQMELSIARLKDIDRILLIVYMVCTNPNTVIYSDIIKELTARMECSSRVKELILYHGALANILSTLTKLNIYPINLIQFMMNSDYVSMAVGTAYSYLGREYIAVYYNTLLDMPTYTEFTLPKRVIQVLTKKLEKETVSLRENSKSQRILLEIFNTLKEDPDFENVYLDRLLPQYAVKTIIVALAEDNQTVPVRELLTGIPFGEFKYPPALPNVTYKTILVMSQLHFKDLEFNYTGKLLAHVRHLKCIGYEPVVIPEITWQKTPSRRKLEYIKSCIFPLTSSSESQ